MNAAIETLATVPIADAAGLDVAQLSSADAVHELGLRIDTVAQRAPLLTDLARWRHHVVGGREYVFAQPITFTPYAAARPCSARCQFCSENLRDASGTTSSSTFRPGARYFEHLQRALQALEGLPIGYSLSGLETTDDAEWLSRMLTALHSHGQRSPVHERVLYTNAAGFADRDRSDALVQQLVDFDLSWAEVSRHHFDADINQRIMRFRDGVAAQDQEAFEAAIRALAHQVPVKLVCIVQAGGIADTKNVERYLDWAHTLGVTAVIFREFSQLPSRYLMNRTARYIGTYRAPMRELLRDIVSSPLAHRLHFHRATEGYYFWNVIARDGALDVIFEASDYERMHAMHDSDRIYKLVLHTNGNLCGGWDPQRQIILQATR